MLPLVRTAHDFRRACQEARLDGPLALVPTTSVFGQAVSVTATVSPVPPGAGTLTGTVTFSVDGNAVATVNLNGSAQASTTLGNLTVGSHSITADMSQRSRRTAVSTMASNTGCVSVGDWLITRRMSDVAVCRVSAS